MKLIIKSLYKKRIFQFGVLIAVFTFTILTMQMSATITLKNETLIDQVNAVKGAHTTLYTANRNMSGDPAIGRYLEEFNEYNEMSLLDTYYQVYYTGATVKEDFDNEALYEITPCMLEGYSEKDGKNQYHVVKGKPLDQLNGNEIAINERYAKTLGNSYDEVMGKKLTQINVASGNFRDLKSPTEFTVASIFEDPITGVLSDDSKEAFQLFEPDKESVSISEHWGFMNEKLAKQSYAIQPVVDEEDPIYLLAYKVYYDDYSMDDEAALLTLLSYNTTPYIGTAIEFQPFYMLLLKESMSQSIFQFLSYILLAALLIADFFIFYAFLKRQLDEDKEKLALMSLSGVKRKDIIKAYLFEIGMLMGISILIVIGLDSIAYLLGFQNMPYVSIFYQMTNAIVVVSILGTMLLTVLLMIICTLAIWQFFRKDIIHFLKEKDFTIQKHAHKRIRYKAMLFDNAWRDLISSKWKMARVLFASTFILLCLMLTYSSYQSMTNLYNQDTMGIHFDYMIGGVSEKEFETLKEKYVDHISYLAVESKYYVERVNVIDDISIEIQYPATLMRVYGDMSPFVSLHDGAYPTKARHFVPEEGWIYEDEHVLLSRRLMDMKGADLVGEDDIIDDLNKGKLNYTTDPYNFYANFGSVYIKGNTDAIVNNGYSSFTLFEVEDGLESLVIHKSRDLDFEYGGTILNLKDGVSQKDVEAYLNKVGTEFIRYDVIEEQLNEANARVQEKTFVIMIAVMGIMIVLFVLLTIANIAEDVMHKKNQTNVMYAIGYPTIYIKRWMRVRSILLLTLSGVFALLLYLPIKWLYDFALGKAVGVYTFPQEGSLFVWIVGIGVMIGSLICFMRRRK